MVVASFRENADPSLDDSEDDADAEEGGVDDGGAEGAVDEEGEDEEEDEEGYSTASAASIGGRSGGGRARGGRGSLEVAAVSGSGAAESTAAAGRRALHRLYRRVTLRAVLIDLGFAAVVPLPCLGGKPWGAQTTAAAAAAAPAAAAAAGAAPAAAGAPAEAGHGDAATAAATAGEQFSSPDASAAAPSDPSAADPEPLLPPLAWHTTLFGTRYAVPPEVWRAADAASAASLAARAAAAAAAESHGGLGRTQAAPPPLLLPAGRDAGDSRCYTRAVDAWGLGVIAYYVLLGAPPFAEGPAGAAELKADILAGAYPRGRAGGGGDGRASRALGVAGGGSSSSSSSLRPVPWGALHPDARALISGLLTVDPLRRWTPVRALLHPWTIQRPAPPPPPQERGSPSEAPPG